MAEEKKEKSSVKEEVYTETCVTVSQNFREFPVVIAESDWLRKYFFIFRVLNPVKQLDLPSDCKSWNSIHCKLIHSTQKPLLAVQQQISRTSKFLRLLSSRHSDGFYVYSLGELII